jgi:hypothetical protein
LGGASVDLRNGRAQTLVKGAEHASTLDGEKLYENPRNSGTWLLVLPESLAGTVSLYASSHIFVPSKPFLSREKKISSIVKCLAILGNFLQATTEQKS